MKIEKVQISNFRSIKNETIEFDEYTCFVGANGSGKSNVLNALNIFFRQSGIPGLDPQNLRKEDFYNKDTQTPIEIVLTFGALSNKAKDDFAHYERQGKLIVSVKASFNGENGRAEVKQFGKRLGIEEFSECFEKDARARQVRCIYERLRKKYSGLPELDTKEDILKSLENYEKEHADECEEIDSSDEFYGASRGAGLLEKYIQWIYIPAVKDVSDEQEEAKGTAFEKLLSRTVRNNVDFEEGIKSIQKEAEKEYSEVLKNSRHQLNTISEVLGKNLALWSHEDTKLDLKWHQKKDISLENPIAKAFFGESGFEGGELTNFGHGFQRSFIFALLQTLSENENKSEASLILACEEPELYQHPPQSRHLCSVLNELSETSQILVTTHSPYFVSGESFENIRMVRKTGGESIVTKAKYDDVSRDISDAYGRRCPSPPPRQLAKIHQFLQPEKSEMFFASKIVLVEGPQDVAYITTYLHLMERWDDFRKLGGHIISVAGKSNLSQPIAVATNLKIPIFVVFDSDRCADNRDNKAILKLLLGNIPDSFPTETLFANNLVMWRSCIEQDVSGEIDGWENLESTSAHQYGGNPGKKNPLHISNILKLAWEDGKKSTSLRKTCEKILEFAKEQTSPPKSP